MSIELKHTDSSAVRHNASKHSCLLTRCKWDMVLSLHLSFTLLNGMLDGIVTDHVRSTRKGNVLEVSVNRTRGVVCPILVLLGWGGDTSCPCPALGEGRVKSYPDLAGRGGGGGIWVF